MKQKNNSLPSKIASLSLVHREVKVSFDKISLVPFVLSKIKKRVVLEVSPALFDDLFSSFPNKISGVVGVPLLDKKTTSLFISYHLQTLKRTKHFVSSRWKDVSFCVASRGVLEVPLFDAEPLKKLTLLHTEDGFDKLLFFLKEHNFVRSETVEEEGFFAVRGFIVDVWGFGQKNIFRYNFYPDDLFYEVDPLTQNIVSSKKSITLYSDCKKAEVSLSSKISNEDVFVEVFNQHMLIKSPLSSKGFFEAKEVFKAFNYFDFKNSSSSVYKKPSSFLLSSACLCEGCLFYPSWFSEKKTPSSSLFKNRDVFKIEVGNFYVHEVFGVCVFVGFEESFKKEEERLCLRFADGVLKLSPKKLNMLSFYASREAGGIALNSLNKKGVWLRKKQSAFLSAENYILSTYKSLSKRVEGVRPPYIFDESLFSLFMSLFKYKDTDDQALAWKNILKDLVSNKPMDRLLCGDVGFGKTEVALRAAFLAFCSSRTVVVLAPTTLLSQQLFSCFNERLSPFGCTIKEVSRLSKNNANSISAFNNKKVDVLVGTHALIKGKTSVCDVGLYIVDEEHRFGVKDKESLLIANPLVDFLYMSATPIPRSLQISLSGIRKISTMLSPPSLRKSIITNVCEFNKSLFLKVVLEEVSRGGQVYVVDNSVKNVKALFSFISSSLPALSVFLIHGGLGKKEIKTTMSLFRSKKIDVLVSTSIIESGIDVSSANTIIINNSHLFGLAQLYQMRGRVGRSEKQAFAYLFVPFKKQLSKEASLRLSSLVKHSSLGSGYQVSISDLEIRGSGDLFGIKQTGLSSVGFHFYSKLIALAVEKNKFKPKQKKLPSFSLGRDFLNSSYVPSDSERLDIYSKLNLCFSSEDLSSLTKDVENKFGPMPQEALNLFQARSFALSFKNKGLLSAFIKDGFLILEFSEDVEGSLSKILNDFGGFLTNQGFNFTYIKREGVFGISIKTSSSNPYFLIKKLLGFLYD